jgi:hypothetical protein
VLIIEFVCTKNFFNIFLTLPVNVMDGVVRIMSCNCRVRNETESYIY